MFVSKSIEEEEKKKDLALEKNCTRIASKKNKIKGSRIYGNRFHNHYQAMG
jgi:hypothetical protein